MPLKNTLIIFGRASKTYAQIEIKKDDLQKNLLQWLVENKVTVASSCGGHGVCKKCHIQKSWLTCQITVDQFIKLEPSLTLYFDYL